MVADFTWDAEKARRNLLKHSIAFEDATRVFLDRHHVSEVESYVEGEERWRTIGMMNGEIVVLVIHTTLDHGDLELIRIISARRADRKERRYYEENYGSL